MPRSLFCPIFKKKKHRHNKEHYDDVHNMSASSTDVLGDFSPVGKAVREISPRSRESTSQASKSSGRSKATKTTSSSGYTPLSIRNDASRGSGMYNSRDDDSSLPTIDPDYNPASDNFSLSDAGGTIGSQSQSLSVFGSSQVTRNSHHLYNHNTTYQPRPYPQTSAYNASSYKQHQQQQQLQPKLLEIYAPSGKLGVVIDVPLNSPTPLVHAIKDSCPIRNEISVGDALIAVDDVDVRNMNAVQVSKLISRKSGQEVRKLSLLRRQQYPSDQLMNIGIVSGEDVYGLR